MPRLYTAVFSSVAVTAAQDLFEITAPSDACVVIHDLHFSQSTELADAAEEQLVLLVKRGATTSGSGGSTPTPAPIEFGDVAFGGVVEANNTTKASVGTITTHFSWNWNIRMPFDKIWTPETRFVLSPSQRMTVELVSAPADSVTMSGTITFAELGG